MTKAEQIINTLNNLTIKRVQKNGVRFYSFPGQDDLLPSVSTVLSIIDQPILKKFERDRLYRHIKKSIEEKKSDKQSEFLWKLSTMNEFDKKGHQMINLGGLIGTDSHEAIEVIVDNHLEKNPVPAKSKLNLTQTKKALVVDKNDEPIIKPQKTRQEIIIEKSKEIPQEMLKDVPEKVKNIENSFKLWKENCGLNLEHNDTIVFSSKFKYAGACDAIGRKPNGDLVLLDWKTSTSLSPNYSLQVSAYAKAVTEMTGEKITEAWIVKFDKSRPYYETYKVKDIDSCFNGFLSALNLWNIFNVHKYRETGNANDNDFFESNINGYYFDFSPENSRTFKLIKNGIPSEGGIVIPDKIKKIRIPNKNNNNNDNGNK